MRDGTSVNLSIDVPDLDTGLKFYRAAFGFTESARPFPTMAVLDAGNLSICMHQKTGGTESSPGSGKLRSYERHWTPVHMDIHVEDFDTCLEVVEELGGTIERIYRTEGPRPVAFCADPFGHGFCVLGPAPGALHAHGDKTT